MRCSPTASCARSWACSAFNCSLCWAYLMAKCSRCWTSRLCWFREVVQIHKLNRGQGWAGESSSGAATSTPANDESRHQFQTVQDRISPSVRKFRSRPSQPFLEMAEMSNIADYYAKNKCTMVFRIFFIFKQLVPFLVEKSQSMSIYVKTNLWKRCCQTPRSKKKRSIYTFVLKKVSTNYIFTQLATESKNKSIPNQFKSIN